MSVETAPLEDLGRELGERIANCGEYQAYEAAREAVENDDEAQARIERFEQLRQEFMLARQTGRADREMLQKVQDAQDELHSLPVMAAFLDAQDALDDRLESINEAISAPLSVDFGGEAGGCCQD
ncbi:YlbF family regulator [Haloferacaceae archaeon DSL9]